MIKHGRRIPRGRNRIPREWLLRKIGQIGYAPALRASAPTVGRASASSSAQRASPTSETLDTDYRVAVTYVLGGGVIKTFSGTFLARNASGAESQGRSFVLRFIRPKQITDAIALPI